MPPTFDNPGTNVLSPSKLSHVVLRTANFPTMVTFYKTFLSATPSFESDLFSFMSYDAEHHRIGILNLPDLGPKDTAHSGLEHIAFTFPTLDDLALSYLQRKSHGIEPFWCVNHGPTTSVYYKDPDGNILETQVDNFDRLENVEAFVTGEAYRVNPIGVDFEMAELIERLKKGEDHGEIKKRMEIGPRGMETVPT